MNFNFLNNICKLETFNNDNKIIKFFTGFIYRTESQNHPYYQNEAIYIVTAKHCITDDDYKLKITLATNKIFEIKFNEYKILADDYTDLVVIKITNKDFLQYHFVDFKNIYSISNSEELINATVITAGFYQEDINTPLIENGVVNSLHSLKTFYIKSKYICNGYSGAPVLIELPLINSNSSDMFLIGFISRNIGNDNIEIVYAAETLKRINQKIYIEKD